MAADMGQKGGAPQGMRRLPHTRRHARRQNSAELLKLEAIRGTSVTAQCRPHVSTKAVEVQGHDRAKTNLRRQGGFRRLAIIGH